MKAPGKAKAQSDLGAQEEPVQGKVKIKPGTWLSIRVREQEKVKTERVMGALNITAREQE